MSIYFILYSDSVICILLRIQEILELIYNIGKMNTCFSSDKNDKDFV